MLLNYDYPDWQFELGNFVYEEFITTSGSPQLFKPYVSSPGVNDYNIDLGTTNLYDNWRLSFDFTPISNTDSQWNLIFSMTRYQLHDTTIIKKTP